MRVSVITLTLNLILFTGITPGRRVALAWDDTTCAEVAIPVSQKYKTSSWPVGGSVGLSSPDTNYGAAQCPGQFVVELSGPVKRPKLLHFAYIPGGGINSESECEATRIEVTGYSYIYSKVDQFWRLDGLAKKHGVWKGYCSFEYDPGSGDVYSTPPKPEDKSTEAGGVEIGAAAATAYIQYTRTVARAFQIKPGGKMVKKKVWAGVQPK